MTTCICGCGKKLVQQRAWTVATSAQRATWLATGYSVIQGRGLARPCYHRARRAGEIPRAGQTAQPKPCSRCGAPKTDGLCRDCRDVTTDLRELERWAS
jgi:hypothetical protein